MQIWFFSSPIVFHAFIGFEYLAQSLLSASSCTCKIVQSDWLFFCKLRFNLCSLLGYSFSSYCSVSSGRKYFNNSLLSITQTLRGNRQRFKLSEVGVNQG